MIGFASTIFLTLASCQNTAEKSESWKQQKIAALYQNYAQEFPLVKNISVEQLQQLQQQKQKIVLVDVRSPEEISVSMIPGAITKSEFEQNFQGHQDSQIIAYCTIGYRSGKYAEQWRQQGIEILNLEGSLLAWSHIQGRLVNNIGATNRVHVFGRQWQLTARDYQSVW